MAVLKKSDSPSRHWHRLRSDMKSLESVSLDYWAAHCHGTTRAGRCRVTKIFTTAAPTYGCKSESLCLNVSAHAIWYTKTWLNSFQAGSSSLIIKTSLQLKHVRVYLGLGTFWEYHQSNQSYRCVQHAHRLNVKQKMIWTKSIQHHATQYISFLQKRTSTLSANSTSPAASFTASKLKSTNVCRNDRTIATWKVQSPRNQDLPHRVMPPAWDCI